MTKYYIVIYENITDKCVQIPRSCEQAALPLTIINTNYLHLEQEVQQLPVHSTSFPPVAVIVLFILCFFLYAFCSHVGPSRHLKCLSRREAFHHNTSKDVPFLFFFSLSHSCWFPCVWQRAVQSSLAHTGTHQHPRDSRPQPSQDAQLLFCAPLAGKSIFVQIILATSLVYSVLKSEPLCTEPSVSLVARSHSLCKGRRIPSKRNKKNNTCAAIRWLQRIDCRGK